MTHEDDESGELSELSNREFLRILMREIVDTRSELKGDIADVDEKLSNRIDGLEEKIDTVSSELHTLRLEVHQNHSSFMANHNALEKRVTVLELAGSRA